MAEPEVDPDQEMSQVVCLYIVILLNQCGIDTGRFKRTLTYIHTRRQYRHKLSILYWLCIIIRCICYGNDHTMIMLL